MLVRAQVTYEARCKVCDILMMIIPLCHVSTGIYLWKLLIFFLIDPNALTETVTPVVLGHWLKEKPASGPRGCWDPNESRHNLWSFPEGKTEALFRFIVRHYSQPSMSLLCKIQWQVRLGTYTLHHKASELARQYFKLLRTLWHPLFRFNIMSTGHLIYCVYPILRLRQPQENIKSILFSFSNT